MSLSRGRLILRSPLQFAVFAYAFILRIILILVPRILLPAYPKYQSLRTELQRAYQISATLHFPAFSDRSLVEYHVRDARPLISPDGTWKAYVIPGHDAAALEGSVGNKNARVVLYAHGGGYIHGSARMYVPHMKRWARVAGQRGIDLLFVSLEYSLSGKAPHPTQRNEFIAAYEHLLKLGIPSSRIIFMGDSAGGGICINTSLHLSSLMLTQPSCNILISPWLDLVMTSFLGGNAAITSDFLPQINDTVPVLIKQFLGGKTSPMDPDVNPLFRRKSDISVLCPQLIFAGGAEFALGDSKTWAEKCREANVKCELEVAWGQLHIWAMGSRWIEPRLRAKTDGMIISWIEGRF